MACSIRGVLEEIGQHAVYTLQSVTIATLASGKRKGAELVPLGVARAR